MDEREWQRHQRAFERNVVSCMPKWALMNVVAEIKRGKFPAGISVPDKRRFLRMATVFEALVQQGIVKIKPLKFNDHSDPYEFPNFRLVKGRTKPSHIEIRLHPLISERYGFFKSDLFQDIRNGAERHLAMTIAGATRFYHNLCAVMASNARKTIA